MRVGRACARGGRLSLDAQWRRPAPVPGHWPRSGRNNALASGFANLWRTRCALHTRAGAVMGYARSEPKMWDQEPPPRDRYRGPSANTRGDKTTYGNKSVKNMNRTADPQTISLNRTLRAALRTARAAAGGLEQIPDLLETTAAPFNHLTVKYALRLTRKMSDKTPRAKLAFAVRVVQRARRDNARLDSYSLLHTLALAKPFRKVNLIRALKRVVEQHHMEQEHQQNNRRHSQAALLMETYFRLVSHWALCGRPALRDASVLEMMRAYQTQDADVFERLLSYLIYRQQTDAAVAIWKLMGAPALPAGQPIDVGLLNAGTLLCSVTHDAAQAQRIVRKYKEMCFTPKPDVFFILMSIFIKAKRLDRARKLMRWMSGLVGYKYVLHERELHEYVRICLESGTEAEDLLPLADLLVCTERLCGNAVDRLGFFRAYFKALQSGVSEGRLSSRVREVADCAGRVFKHWEIEDNVISSRMAYLASHGERLDMALRVARDNFQRQRNLPLSASRVIAGVHGLLRTYAYEAIAEQSVLSGRVPDAISLLFGTNGTEPQYPHGTAYILVACYIRAFGKLGRLDLSADVFDTYSRLHEGNAFVSNSYLFALGHAGHRMDAVALVRRLENAQKVGAPVIDGVTYSALGKILLEGLSSSATNDLCDPAQAVPVDTVVEMLGHMEAYLDGVGEQLPKCFVSDKAPRAVDVQNQAYQNRSLSRKSNTEMEGASSKDTIPGIIAQIRKKLSVRQNGQ